MVVIDTVSNKQFSLSVDQVLQGVIHDAGKTRLLSQFWTASNFFSMSAMAVKLGELRVS